MKKLRTAKVEYEGNFFEVVAVVDDEDEALPVWADDAELAVVGRGAVRSDGAQKVAGAATFTVDVRLPRMLHTAVLRSPFAHARVMTLDLEAALSVPGVRVVLGPEDEMGGGSNPLTAEPRFAGAAIAAVAAETPEAAAAGVHALAPLYEQLPFTVALEDALNAQQFTTDPSEVVRGEAGALAEAEVVVELEVETPFHIQSPLETHAATADWKPELLTVWASTQSPFMLRDTIAGLYGLPKTGVHVISEFVGGAFGAKVGATEDVVLATELSRRARRPVSVTYSRHEEQQVGGHRAATRQTVRLGSQRDGTITAIELDAVMGMGAEGGWVPPIWSPAMALYRSPNAHRSAFPVRLNLRPINAFRAPGVVEGTTALEQAMDELATALGLDPLELRRRAFTDVDQPRGKPYSGKALLECYDRAAALSGWVERERLREGHPDGLLRGLGCASQIWGGGGGPPAHATVRIGSDGIAVVTTGLQDTGTGILTSARIVAAEELGLPIDRVRAVGGDTGPNVYGPVAGGSQSTGAVMPAVRASAARTRRALLEVAGDLFEALPDDLLLQDGRIVSRDRTLNEPYTAVTDRLGNASIDGSGARGMNDDAYAVQTWGCQIAQVAVDPGVGRVVVEKVWAVHDVGRIINPLLATSQVEGGILQGVGYALLEERIVDPTTGAPTNATFDDYKLPTIADTPEIVIEFIDRPDTIASSTGAKGLGEPPLIPTAAAIANAFAHATGRRCRAIPLTPARVLEVLA